MCDFLHPGWLDPLYKPHFVCFECRKHLKLRDENVERFWQRWAGQPGPSMPGRAEVGARCPDCRAPLVPVCACFRAPRRTQLRRWKQLRAHHRG